MSKEKYHLRTESVGHLVGKVICCTTENSSERRLSHCFNMKCHWTEQEGDEEEEEREDEEKEKD